MTIYQITFLILASITVVSAALVVLLPNLLRSALFLVVTFLGIAGIYLLLHAPFLFAAQIVIYVGAIMVLMLFAVLLTQKLAGAKIIQTSQWLIPGAMIAGLFLAMVMKVIVTPFKEPSVAMALVPSTAGSESNAVFELARLLLQPYVLPFELASVILLAALIAAIVIGKEERSDASD